MALTLQLRVCGPRPLLLSLSDACSPQRRVILSQRRFAPVFVRPTSAAKAVTIACAAIKSHTACAAGRALLCQPILAARLLRHSTCCICRDIGCSRAPGPPL